MDAAAFVLDADSGKFGASKTARSANSVGVRTVKSYVGTATDTQILAVGKQRVLADTTLASSPNKAERAGWAASSKFVDLSWPSTSAR
ncbi:hypothetical protein [Streptomyces sp. MZ04]|uniref:hypothetical protein n=1 Tax=Streptomyces sp. MZ04 TaxID=2559236 RepID=UPI001ADF13CD|nr:hypothetical protein [Streptomyces sp. MZ04]